MPATVHVEFKGFIKAVDEYAKAVNKSKDQVMRESMGGIAAALVRYTYNTSKKQGETAVERDIRRVFKQAEQAKEKPQPLNPADHENARDNRGRVPRKLPERIPVRTTDLLAYIQKVKTHVGTTPAGWLPAVTKFKGASPKPFVRRHGPGEGTATDQLGRLVKGYVEAVNKAKGIGQEGSEKIVKKAIRNYLRNLRIRIEHELGNAAKKYGAK